MDAFDNPARNGMAGLQRDGLPTDQSSGAVAGSDLLSATARATATASAMPLAIQAILVPDASGRIVLPAGASIDDISVSGTDLIVTLPNGQVLIVPNGAVDVPAIVVDGDTVPASTVAQLLEGLADFNPEAGIRSSGGNFADPEGPIQDAYALGDLLPYTELAFPQPEDRELLPDVPDEEPEVVIVTPDQPAGATAATASVDEAGLPARGGEPAGSDSAANSESTTGTIVYDVADGLGAITINGTAITAVGQVVTTPLGQLTITSLTPGSVGYSYTLADNTDANANLTDVFTVVITDRDGDSATATLTIDVIDDVPTARADTDTVAAGSFAPETGNVLTGAGTTSGSAGIDTPGADGATLTGVRPAGGEGGFSAPGTVTGQYGTLTLNADGSYSYVRNPGTPGGVDDVFAYQITDGDGDTSTATLTIGIADSPTVITFVPGDGGGDGGTIVYEADLPGRNGETPGSAFGGGGGGASTSGTITFTAIDGVGSVSLGGTVLTPGSLPQTVSSDAMGTLVVTGYSYDPATGAGSITYVYTLIDNTLDSDGTTVSFDLTVTDADGDPGSDTLDILIVDDVPTARDDADSVTEDGPLTADGNVLRGLGGGDANATDGVADTQGADGASVTALAGGSVGAPLAGAYGTLTLNADGSYSYVLNNAAQPVQGLSAGETLTETFTYTITDGDGDTSSATLTITINGADDGVTITGLDAEGGELTLDEDDLADGSSPDAAALTQTGSFTVSTPDGLGNVTVGGTQVVTNGVFTAGTATSPLGTVNITGFTPVTGADGSVIGGTFTYEYVLADNTLTHASPGEDNVTDSFAVVVTDGDGSTASASLDVRIIDDVPTARDDADSVTEDGPLTADGNVLRGLGGGDANATDGVADTQGADGATVTAIAGGTVGTPFATAYGTLTLNADGSYSYVLNNAAQPVQGLSAGETLTETFTYTITDGDGDTSSATLTITINGADDGVTITGLDAVGAEVTVDEDDLADGSSPDAAALTQANSFTISTPDGLGNVTVGGTQVVTNGVFTAGTATSPLGTVNITGFTPLVGTDGSVIGGTFTYEYVLADNTLTHASPGEDNVTDSFAVVVTDSDGSIANASLDVRIVDDVPTAADDSASAAEDTPVVIDVLANDVRGADGIDAATGVALAAAPTKGVVVYNGDGTFTYTPTAGEEGEDSFTYTITDGDGDISTATVTVTLAKDSVPTIDLGADNSVDEAGLPNGSNAASNSETATGGFTLTTGNDSVASLVINGVDVTAGGTVTTPIGVLTVMVSGGVYSYSYTLTTNTSGDNTFDSFTAVVTDSDGDTATDTLVIDIVDDVPTANADVDSVTEDGPLVADGNVLTGSGGSDANDSDGVADTQGADGATVTAVAGGAVGAPLVSTYGTLTLNADGSYSYILDNSNTAVQGLSAGQTLTETFTYTITDGDGDPSSATLTITINGADDGVTITGLDVAGGEEVVNEDDLADGSSPDAAALTQPGSFTISTPDGLGNVTIGSAQVVTNGVFTPGLTTSSALGTVTITGFTSVLASDGSVIGGTFTYEYVLDDNTLTHPAAGEDNVTDSFAVTVTDSDGSTANASLDITVIDDVPTAAAEANQNVAEGATVTGTLDFIQGADGASVTAINGTTLVFGMDGFSQAIDIGDGTIKIKADGSYSFTADASVAGTGSASATYTVTDGDGDISTAPISFTIVDANAPTAGQTEASVDDDALSGGNPASMTGDLPDANSDGDNNQATFSGLLNLDFGGDGAGSVNFAAMHGMFVTIGQESVQLTWNGGTNTLTGTGPRGALFTVELTDPTTGAYKVTLLDNVLHTPGGDENDATAVLGFTVIDSDGSTASGTLRITFDDDAPTVTASGTQPVLTVDESALGVDAPASFASVFTPVFGADGAALANDTTYTLGIGVGATGLIDSATNEAVVLHLNGNVVEGRTVTSDALVFTVSVAANGTVTLDQLRAVLHTPDSGVDQPTGLVADDLITLTATVTDGDGDSATATANIGQNLVFRDDAPVANDDAAGLTEGGPSSVTFDVDTNDNAGADGVGSRIFASLTGSYGTITLNGDGTQTYTLTPAGQAAIDALPPGATLTDVFTYTLTDKDGDSDPATLTITLTGTDDGVTITNLTPKLDGGDATVDEDDLPAGSDTAKESLTATGSFNISAPDGVADLSIHGTQVIANGVFTPATIITPLGNTLDITAYNPATGEVSYSYTLNAAETHAGIQGENSLFEDFVVDLTDTDGDHTDSILSINIVDDVPTAASDPAIVVAEDAAPVGGNLLANDVQGADGATVTSVTIGGNVTSINAVGTTVVVTANGTYSFTATGVWSFDPNPVSNAAPVDAGFTYTITDGDGDTSTAAQAISLVDGNGPGNAGSITLALDDQNLADGSTPAGPDFDSDTLVFTQGSDAITSIVFANSVAGLGGGLTWLRVSDTQITGSDGARLVVTLDLVRSGDSATITATLNDNYDGHTGIDVDDLVNLGSVGVVATDADGDTATGSVTVTISDDLPTARPDTDSVTEDAPGDATGNVITGVGTTNSPGSADTQGADGAAVTGVAAGMSPTAVSGNVGSALAGSYGTLTLNANGGYTYTLNNANGTVQALGVGDTLTETFTYTITDGDNDTSTTTLTITINGANDAPTIGSATTAVSDEGLAGGLPDNMGTVDTTNLAVRMGTIAVNDVDGDALTVSLGTPATALFSGGQPVVWDTTNPQLLLGKVGTETIISVSINNSGNFTVTLSGPIDHPDTTQEDALSLVVPVSVNDGTTTVTNATALTIGLEDDSPIAVSPFGTSLTNVGGASVLQFLDADNDVDNNFGGDGGKVIFTAATIAALEAQDLTSGLAPLTYSISNGGQVLTAEKANGDDVFIITLQPAGSPDQYRVEIIRPLDAVTEVDFNAAGYDFSGGNPAWNFFRDAGTADSKDILLTPIGPNGQTVNTNANSGGIGGGGGGGAIGTGEGMRIDFVIDLLGNPASGGAGYQVPANRNHSFSDHYVVNGASAVFASTSGSTVRFATKDDPDGNDAVGDGAADPITAVAIRFGAQTVTVNASATPQPVTVGGQNYTVTFVGGEVLISGIVTNTQVALFTADGYNSMEITYVSGSDFRIGDFGASAITTTDPVPFTVPVAVIDGDGDTSALADINITANPAPPPVVLDLDGDGIEYLSAASGVTFDYAGDGHASTTAWVGPNDGLLAFDANGNGRVDNGTEIVFGGNGLTDLQGLAARFDSNGDGVLDRHDADFARFGVWQDANSNGVADDGEFRTLDQAGIVSINLVSDGRPHTTANGDVHVFGESSYTLADGTVRIVADAAFANTGIARTQDRPATAMLLTDALVAASLITMAQGAQADERVSPRSVAEDEFLPRTVDEAAAPAAAAETADSTVLLDQGTVVATAAARAVDTAAHHADTAFQVNASIADSRDYGWRGEDMIAKDGGSTDALFDAPSATAGTASAMDGLLMLGLAAAEAAAAQAASVSAQDPAATAVLAEVLDAGNAIDRLIDAVAGPARVEMAHTENPAFDLAALLDQNVTPDAAAVVPPSVELDLHQMATA